MANYAIYIQNTPDSFTFSITNVVRNPTTVTISGGTNLNTTTLNTGFQQAATTTSDGLGHVLTTPGDAIMRCIQMINDDRALNG